MKANQNFKAADEAVSPVIGVILMVAITVVLAAVVFVLVNDLGSGADSAPTMGLTSDEGDDRLNVDKAPSDSTSWDDMVVSVQGANASNVCVALNTAPTSGATCAANQGVDDWATLANRPTAEIGGGDYLEFCMDTTTGATDDVTVVVTHEPSGQVVKRSDFSNIAAC